MSYTFPDVEKCLLEVIGQGAAIWLDMDMFAATPVHHVQGIGGIERGPLRMDRVQVMTYAPGRDDAHNASEIVKAKLLAGPHATAYGLIDSVEVEVAPRLMPYMDDSLILFAATYRVHTRPIN